MDESFDIQTFGLEEEFYLRFYSGGYKDSEHGHEFLEFDIRHNPGDSFATLRYANQSNYRDEDLIKKELGISILVLETIKKIVRESQILLESDYKWPKPVTESKNELEIRSGSNKKIFKTKGINSIVSVKNEEDSNGLACFYYLIQDLKVMIFSLVSIHFKVNPL